MAETAEQTQPTTEANGAPVESQTPAPESQKRGPITADSLSANVTVPPRSRTFSPEAVQKVSDMLTGKDPALDGKPVESVGIGEFDSEGAARSALVALNRLLSDRGHEYHYASTVRQTDNLMFQAIMLNKRAKAAPKRGAKPGRKPNAAAAS